MLNKVLHQAEVKEEGARWPILEDIQVTYTCFLSLHGEFNPSGFYVRVKFTASLTEEIGSKELRFFLESKLDPQRTMEGKAFPDQRFTPEDKLGDVSGNGGVESWNGGEKMIERNKKKYLKQGRSF